jgi:transposase
MLDGAMDGPHFLAYVEQILAPTLKKGDIVFMDNVSTHLVDGVEEAIEARGAHVFYLPPYSPDFNPIEQLFAKSHPPAISCNAKRSVGEDEEVAIATAADCPPT